MSFSIYCIINITNGKVYVGKALNVEKRFKQHITELTNNKHSNKHLQGSWNKYGINNFRFEILENTYIEEDLNNKEKYWILHFKSYDNKFGYNKTYGGDGGRMINEIIEKTKEKLKGRRPSKETKKKLSEKMKDILKNKVHWTKGSKAWNRGLTKENNESMKLTSEKLKIYNKENKHSCLGRKLTEEEKQKISKSHKGKHKSKEHKENLSKANLGKKLSEETKNKMSISKKGIPQKKLKCPYCEKEGGITMYRWHFENCKDKS